MTHAWTVSEALEPARYKTNREERTMSEDRTYKDYQYKIWQEDGYWHWLVEVGEGGTVTSFDKQGSPAFGGKDTEGKARQAVKAAINRLVRIGF